MFFTQPLDLVKNRMQMSGKSGPYWPVTFESTEMYPSCTSHLFPYQGEGGKGREHRTSFHAILRILRNEGFLGIYNGSVIELYYIYKCECCIISFAV